MRSLQPCRGGTWRTEAMVEHAARETIALIARRGIWYVHTWNDLHLFPVMFLLDTHNISFRDAGG
jgi:hypothetical protein